MKHLFTLLWTICMLSIEPVFSQSENKKTADWMRHEKFGIMVHYLATLQNAFSPHNMGKITRWDSCVNDFNTDLFAKQMNDIGAGYVIFTMYQGTRFICTPSESFEKITGYKRGEATSHRDLIMDLSNSLQKYNIKLFLYVTGDGTYRDQQANVAFKNPMLQWKQNSNKFIATGVWVNNWAGVLQEWSMRYGKRISGWWVDGAFSFHGYNDVLLSKFYYVLKSGNQNSVVAFNPSPQKKVMYYSKWDDYTAGEMNDFKDLPSIGGKINGTQWHIVSYLGTDWKSPAVRYTKKYMVNYINKVNSLGGVVTINTSLFRNGSISAEQLTFLKEVSKKIKKR
jgi:hypothetical protein